MTTIVTPEGGLPGVAVIPDKPTGTLETPVLQGEPGSQVSSLGGRATGDTTERGQGGLDILTHHQQPAPGFSKGRVSFPAVVPANTGTAPSPHHPKLTVKSN